MWSRPQDLNLSNSKELQEFYICIFFMSFATAQFIYFTEKQP